MKSLISTIGGKAVLVVLAVVVVGGGIVAVPKLAGGGLTAQAEKEQKEEFEADSIPYKDIQIETIKKDDIRALLKLTFTIQGQNGYCHVITNADFDESYGLNAEHLKTNNILALSDIEVAQLKVMGLIGDFFDRAVQEKWKRCYTMREYTKSGNNWKGSYQIFGTFDKGSYLILPPEKQKKLGYTIPTINPTSAPTQIPTPTLTAKQAIYKDWKNLEAATYIGQPFTVKYPADYVYTTELDSNCTTQEKPCIVSILTKTDDKGKHIILLGMKYIKTPYGEVPAAVEENTTTQTQDVRAGPGIYPVEITKGADGITAVLAPGKVAGGLIFNGSPVFILQSESPDEIYLTRFIQILETIQLR